MDNDPEHLRRVREHAQRHEIRLILSYHNLSYTPGQDYLVDRFLEADGSRRRGDGAGDAARPRRRAPAACGDSRSDNKTRIP